jgi:hypothetical protein
MKRQTEWLWHTGSIFILLSIAALWALLQINDVPLRREFFWILAIFSVSTIGIWYVAIVRRARKWATISRKRATEIESELKEIFGFSYSLLHTRIQDGDKNNIFTGHRGIILFAVLIIATWIVTGIVVGAIGIQFFG